MAIRPVTPGDATALADLFAAIDATDFHPHPLTLAEAERVTGYTGNDVYLVGLEDELAVSYGMLRGWDEGFATPSLGIAVRTPGRGDGRAMMAALHDVARAKGAAMIRLRVATGNERARRFYKHLGYREVGDERGQRLMLFELD